MLSLFQKKLLLYIYFDHRFYVGDSREGINDCWGHGNHSNAANGQGCIQRSSGTKSIQ